MALSKRLRFEVFKRDDFCCSYCGRRPPVVTLEVDHIIPRADGGTDDQDNLTTSCFDCNRGKADVPLDHAPVPSEIAERTRLMREREEQVAAYNAVKAQREARIQADFARVWEYWFELWDAETLPRSSMPWEGRLRNAVDVLGLVDVLDAMQIVRDRFNRPSASAARYFGGILRNLFNEAGV